MNNSIFISKEKLPNSQDTAIDLLYEHFNGFDLKCIEHDKHYELKLSGNYYTYCEDISDGLIFLGIDKESIGKYCVITNTAALCLSENWLPYAHIVIKSRQNADYRKLTVIHIDDHSDLMPPFICKDGIKYRNLITGEQVDFNDSISTKKAIESGAITIGSMLTAIVYHTDQVKIFHMKHDEITKKCSITKSNISDSILDTNSRISISRYANYDEYQDKYILTSDWKYVTSSIEPNTDCVLHIDMDYFNNRFNASTSWQEVSTRHDPPFIEQKVAMDSLFTNISKIIGVVKVRCVLIGISPSFYPVEYWKSGLTYLLSGLKKIGLDVDGLLQTSYHELEGIRYDEHF